VKIIIAGAATLALAACAVAIDERSLLPDFDEPTAEVSLVVPEGYVRSDALIPVGDLGVVHAVRLDRADSETTILVAGGSGYFTAKASRRLARLAELTGFDIVTFDYPGRSGSTLQRSARALIEMGTALVSDFRKNGWLGDGPVYAYGYSRGGASASNMARTGDFSGLILESTSSDIVAMGRNMVPAVARPLVRLQIDDDLGAFDYFGFAVSSNAPILVIAARDDAQADLKTVNAFVQRLKATGANVTLVETAGGHGDALYTVDAAAAVRAFTAPTR
jgi:pimeloyl-ACP methyl ester carboxylesterase